MMKTIGQLLNEKGRQVWSLPADATVLTALELMAAENIGSVVVLRNGQLCGIVTERDYARKVVLEGKSAHDTPVSEIMTERVLVVGPSRTLDDCMALMTEKRLRHLPVMDGDALIGIISIGDVVKEIISHQQHMIGQLERYITGR